MNSLYYFGWYVCVCVYVCVFGGVYWRLHTEVMKPGWLATCLLVNECYIQHAIMTH